MKVLLRDNFPSLGYVGDIVNVRPGYARNYLIPREIAVNLQSRHASQIEQMMRIVEKKKAALRSDAEELKSKLELTPLRFELKVGGKGKSFGSISPKNILDELLARDFEIDRRQIRLTEPLKSGGEFKVEIKLHSDVVAKLPVTVVTEVVTSKSEETEKDSRKAAGSAQSEDSDSEQADSDAEESWESAEE